MTKQVPGARSGNGGFMRRPVHPLHAAFTSVHQEQPEFLKTELHKAESKKPESRQTESQRQESKILESKILETKRQGPKILETRRPESKIPASKILETKRQESKIPESKIPGLNILESAMPESQKAEAKARELTHTEKETAAPLDERTIQKQHEFEMWRKQETERLEMGKQNLRRQTREMEQERIQLNIEKAHFYRQQEFQETKKKHEEHLLEMKRQILEGELYRLAEEKKQFEQKKSFYDQVEAYQKEDIRTKPASIHGTMFFAGVNSQSSLKKRYKDLLKIYHPDNKCGDTDAIQEINREYQRLMAKLQG